MTIVVIGDVGVIDGMIHIGDEAMFEQAVTQLRSHGLGDVVGLSANPAETAQRYGIDALERIGFSGADADMAARMTAVLNDELATDDPGSAVARAIRASSGVLIAGGGNIASTWPMHVYERATIARLAADAGVPLVISGQTLGPWLTDAHADLVGAMLSSAALVGIREDASFALARRLTDAPERVHRTPDDAAFLAPAERVTDDARPGDYALVTVMPHTGAHDREGFARAIAALLDRVAERHPVVFAPHWGSLRPGDARGDSVMHDRIRSLMTATATEVPARSSRESAALARNASLVVSTRYHPAVFAAAAAVPVIGVPVDDYTRIKLAGALGTSGQRPTDVEDLATIDLEGLGPVPLDGSARQRADDWWDAVAATLRGDTATD